MERPTTMGGYLNAARLRQRVSIQRAAEETRIKREYLMRMESDEFDFLAPAYVRGFLRTYSRFLHVDPEPLLAEFDRRFAHTVDASQIVALERRARRVPKERKRLNRLGRTVVTVVAIVVVLAAIGLFGGGDDEEPAARRSPQPIAAPGTAVPTELIPIVSPTPEPTASATVALVAEDLADGIELEIVARSDCWVDVDADGSDVFSETLAGGSRMTFTADSVMEVVLGQPGSVRLILNGYRLPRLPDSDAIKFTLPDDLDALVDGRSPS